MAKWKQGNNSISIWVEVHTGYEEDKGANLGSMKEKKPTINTYCLQVFREHLV